MSRHQIEWGEERLGGYRNSVPTVDGRVGGLLVARVMQRPSSGGWWVYTFLEPMPDRLDRLTDAEKASERSAKATAQRIVNSFMRILNGEEQV